MKVFLRNNNHILHTKIRKYLQTEKTCSTMYLNKEFHPVTNIKLYRNGQNCATLDGWSSTVGASRNLRAALLTISVLSLRCTRRRSSSSSPKEMTSNSSLEATGPMTSMVTSVVLVSTSV